MPVRVPQTSSRALELAKYNNKVCDFIVLLTVTFMLVRSNESINHLFPTTLQCISWWGGNLLLGLIEVNRWLNKEQTNRETQTSCKLATFVHATEKVVNL